MRIVADEFLFVLLVVVVVVVVVEVVVVVVVVVFLVPPFVGLFLLGAFEGLNRKYFRAKSHKF